LSPAQQEAVPPDPTDKVWRGINPSDGTHVAIVRFTHARNGLLAVYWSTAERRWAGTGGGDSPIFEVAFLHGRAVAAAERALRKAIEPPCIPDVRSEGAKDEAQERATAARKALRALGVEP
jgi:hypothetical protein